MSLKTLLLAAVSFWFCSSVVVAEVLANSGYPMLGANPERNYKIDRSWIQANIYNSDDGINQILCPQVAPGRTTVLSIDWYFPPQNFADTFRLTSSQLTLDEQGNLYVTGMYNQFSYSIFKVNATDGSFDDQSTGYFLNDALDQGAHPTHVKGNKFYFATGTENSIVDTTSMTSIFSIDNPTATEGPSSFVPYGATLMVRSQGASPDSLVYIDSSANIDTNSPTPAFGDTVLPVMVRTTSGGVTPVVVKTGVYPTSVFTADWSQTFAGSAVRAWLDGNELYYLSSELLLERINLTNQADAKSINLGTFQGDTYSWDFSNVIYHNNVLFTQILQRSAATPLVDLLSNTIAYNPEQAPTLVSQPTFLKKDNVVLNFLYTSSTKTLQVRGLEWGTWKTKMVAQFNGSNEAAPYYGLPIVGEDCRMYTVVGNRVYSFAPLPIQDVVPILQCVDLTTNEAYFSYKYLGSGSKDFVIPHVSDRNELTPEGVAPWTDFTAGEGPLYPLSYKVVLNTSAATHTWVLEDYTLTFAVGSSLACPTTANIVIRLSANGLFPVGFEETVRSKFVFVTGITDSRVTIVPQKRSLTQSNTLETELQVGPDPNGVEPSPAEVVRNFVSDNNQQFTFEVSVSGADGSPAGLKVDGIVGQKTGTEVEGTVPPQAPPQADPVSPMGSPTAAPVPSVPIAVTSTSNCIKNSVILLAAVILL